MMTRILAGVLALAWLATAAAAPATAPDAACSAHGEAAFQAWAHGHYDQARRDFAPAFAQQLTAAKLQEVTVQLHAQLGDFQSLGSFAPGTLKGDAVMVAPISFARARLAAVFKCDDADRISAFLILNPAMFPGLLPEAAEAAPKLPPVEFRVQPNGVRVEPLSVPSRFGPLRGALTLPAGEGPFPAVVLVAGSGASDLDETVGGAKPFRDLADGLAAAGVASLRYDKRQVDYPLKMAANASLTVDDEVTDDAVAAARLLARQPQVDARRVFVLGHSEGAMLAPRIARRDPAIAGLVMLAAPARPLLDVLAQQTREQGERAGLTPEKIAAAEKSLADEKQLLAKADPGHPPAGTFSGAPQSWWLSLQRYDQVATARGLDLPMLFLQGGADFQVSARQDFDAWKHALAGRKDATFRLYPHLGHLFTPAGHTGTVADYAAPAHVDAKVVADIAAWIEAQPPAR